MKLEIFNPNDFGGENGLCDHCMSDGAKMANLKLNEWLKENGKVVYARADDTILDDTAHIRCAWREGDYLLHTHTHKALLICIEPLEKCSHPKEKVKVAWHDDPNKKGCIPRFSDEFYECECGAKVEPQIFVERK